MGAPFIDDPNIGTCLTVLPKSQVIGLSFATLAGFISTITVLIFLGLVARNFIRNVRDPPPGGEWRLIRTHVDAYLLSLFSSEILQGLGAIMDVKWVHEGVVYCSNFCTVQGAIQTIGETGVAMGTLAITLHTFFVIFFRWTPGPHSVWIYRIVIPLIWIYLALFVAIGYSAHRGDNPADPRVFFSPTPYWCWIGGGFDVERIVGEYLWLWTALLSSIFFYTLLFFRLRGNIHVDPQDWKRIRVRLQPSSHFPSDAPCFLDAPSAAAYREAMTMIWYPICYTILVLPLSIVRWRTFRTPAHLNLQTPFAVTAVVITIFGLSGVANVVLITLTRRNLLLFGQRRGVVSSQESMNVNEEGFGPGSALAVRSGLFSQGVTGERLPTTSVCSTILPGISLDRNGDIKNTAVGCSNWGSTTTDLAPYIGVRSVVSMGDLSEPMKFGATPSPALPHTVYSGSAGHRKPLSDLELGKKTSETSIHALDERESGRELNQMTLSNVGKGGRTSVRVEQPGSLELEDFGKTKNGSFSGSSTPPGVTTRTDEGLRPSAREQVLRWSTNESRSLLDQEERAHKLLHPLDSAPSSRYPPSYSSSQLPLVRFSIPPVPTGPPPRPLSSRGRGVTDSNAGGVSSVPVRSVDTASLNSSPLTESG